MVTQRVFLEVEPMITYTSAKVASELRM